MADEIRMELVRRPGPNWIPDPRRANAGPMMVGKDPESPSYLCGACGAVLIEGLPRSQVAASNVQCRSCGAFSKLPLYGIRVRFAAIRGLHGGGRGWPT